VSVFLVVNYFEGQPMVRCAHSDLDHASECALRRAHARTGESLSFDEDGQVHVSGHEYYAVEPQEVRDATCEGGQT
jgi:hypothetical protein